MYDTKLTVQERLEDLRKESGLTLEQLAKETGLSRAALGSYETDNAKDIGHYAIVKLAKFYNITTDYLLGLSEIKKHPDAQLNDLHLNDGMIELLKSEQINTPLLCELAMHKDFAKLLADIEIYVNGVATAQIQKLNAWADVARDELVKKYRPGEHDSTAYLLESMQIQEGEYFSRRVHNDVDGIMADIKEAHASRDISSSNNCVIDEIKEVLDEVANFKGSRLEMLIMLFCKQTKLKYEKLTEEEKQWLVQIARKSDLMKCSVSQRGRKKKQRFR